MFIIDISSTLRVLETCQNISLLSAILLKSHSHLYKYFIEFQ